MDKVKTALKTIGIGGLAVTANVVTGLQSGVTYDAGLLGEVASSTGTGTANMTLRMLDLNLHRL